MTWSRAFFSLSYIWIVKFSHKSVLQSWQPYWMSFYFIYDFFFFFFINLFVLFFFCFQQAEAEELDIDLSDPELHKAATKIQASFRGHKVRKDGEPSGQWSSRVDSQFSEQFNHSNKKRNNNNNNNNNNYNNTHSFTSAPQLYNLSINKIIPTTQQQIPYISIPLLSDKSHTFSISISFPCILRNDWLHKY